jgi:hypothetical protein
VARSSRLSPRRAPASCRTSLWRTGPP